MTKKLTKITVLILKIMTSVVHDICIYLDSMRVNINHVHQDIYNIYHHSSYCIIQETVHFIFMKESQRDVVRERM